jgi:hypothetical protein
MLLSTVHAYKGQLDELPPFDIKKISEKKKTNGKRKPLLPSRVWLGSEGKKLFYFSSQLGGVASNLKLTLQPTQSSFTTNIILSIFT